MCSGTLSKGDWSPLQIHYCCYSHSGPSLTIFPRTRSQFCTCGSALYWSSSLQNGWLFFFFKLTFKESFPEGQLWMLLTCAPIWRNVLQSEPGVCSVILFIPHRTPIRYLLIPILRSRHVLATWTTCPGLHKWQDLHSAIRIRNLCFSSRTAVSFWACSCSWPMMCPKKAVHPSLSVLSAH